MRYETYDLDVVSGATGGGVAKRCEDLVDRCVSVSALAGGAAITIEGSIDGTTWTAVTASITVAGMAALTNVAAYKYVRTNRTVQGTGQPVVILAGRNCRAAPG